MIGQCGLAPDINKCPHYISDKKGCGAEQTSCGFYEPPGQKKGKANTKESKWFEQYYRK